jgi:hypothetical protein
MGKADVLGEEMGRSTPGTTEVRDQAPGERLAEITSGRSISQQGLAATCKDLPNEAKAEGGGRVMDWRMSP